MSPDGREDTGTAPRLPRSAPKLEEGKRKRMSAAWSDSGAQYHAARPSYPAWCVPWLLGEKAPLRVVELGAGTGIFTRDLVAAGHTVTAVEPSQSMLEVLGEYVPNADATVVGTGEYTSLDSSVADAVVAAQAWHWCHPGEAGAEAHRLLQGARDPILGLLWNQLDVGVPWVHRLARIMHAGDVHRDPAVAAAAGPGWRVCEIREERWVHSAPVGQMFELARSRSYWLRGEPAVRQRVEANLSWYLFEHLGYQPGGEIHVPYVTLAVRCVPSDPNL